VDRDGDVVSTAIHLHLLYLRIPDPVVHFAWHENDWHAFRFRNQNPGARTHIYEPAQYVVARKVTVPIITGAYGLS
jgi:hypothetical protein